MQPFMSPLYRNIILCIIFACILIQLLPRSDPRAETLRDPFLIAHTLDPSHGPDRGYGSWSISQWRDWTNAREPLHRSAANAIGRRRKHQLNQKPINTVIIATPDEVAQAFYGPLSTLGTEYVWSNRMFDLYIIEINNGRWSVLRCRDLYIAVKLVDGKPVHLDGQYDYKFAKGNIKNFPRKTKCDKLTS